MEISKPLAAFVQPSDGMYQISKQRPILCLLTNRTIKELGQEKRNRRFIRIVRYRRERGKKTSLLLFYKEWHWDGNRLQSLSRKEVETIRTLPPISLNAAPEPKKKHAPTARYTSQQYWMYHCILAYEELFQPFFVTFFFRFN